MSAKRGRRAKVIPATSADRQKASSLDNFISADMSDIEKASFIEGLQRNDGNPLHSTALEEDLAELEEGGTGKENIPKTLKPAAKPSRAAAKRKGAERDGESEKEQQQQKKKKKTISTGGRVKARPVTNQEMKKDKKTKSESGSGETRGAQPQEESDSDTGLQRRRRVLSSDDDDDDVGDASWKPSPKKKEVYSFGKTIKSSSTVSKSKKSSSGSAPAEPEKTNRVERKKNGRRGDSELEVVLDAFLDFCDQYSESVESKAVKQSIKFFSDSVKEQLMEKISSQQELRVLKRENTKLGSLIRTKTQRLLDAKHELIRAERQASLLKKEKDDLKLRLADLKRSNAFLHDIRELNRQYLEYRHTHPKKKETYGVSSLPALLLEAKHIQEAEDQLKDINDQLEKRLKNSGK